MSEREIEDKVRRILAVIEDEGMPPFSKRDWLELLERVSSECDMRAEAAREELKEDGDG